MGKTVLKDLLFLPEGNPESCHLRETIEGAEQKEDSNSRGLAYQQSAQELSTGTDSGWRERLVWKDGLGGKSGKEKLWLGGAAHWRTCQQGFSKWKTMALIQTKYTIRPGTDCAGGGWGGVPSRVGFEEETVGHRTCFGDMCRALSTLLPVPY